IRSTQEVGSKDPLVGFLLQVLDALARADRGDVCEHIDTPELADYASHHRFDIGALAEIGLHIRGVGFRLPSDSGCRLLAPIVYHIHHHDIEALGRQTHRTASPQTPRSRRSGYDSYTPAVCHRCYLDGLS